MSFDRETSSRSSSRSGSGGTVADAVSEAYRVEWARVLSTVIRVTRDFDLAEDCVQDAFAQALVSWTRDGIPDRPGGWLTTVAVRQALQARRRAGTLSRKLPLLLLDVADESPSTGDGFERTDVDRWPDDRLRLVFTCCHPALAPEARTALTLRMVCGMTTVEVAGVFLVRESTMQARITRTKKRIAAAGIAYRTPTQDELPQRLPSVLDTVHLLYAAGHVAHSGHSLIRADLMDRSLSVARMLHELMPRDREATALLALLLLTDSRRGARLTPTGELILLEDQDRDQWNHALIAEALTLLTESAGHGPVDRFAIMAAIATVHATSPAGPDTDWPRLVALYDLLYQRWPSPVVALNRAVAIGQSQGPEAALSALDPLTSDPSLAAYHYLPAARAHFLRRLGHQTEAAAAYQEAQALTANPVEAAYLERRLARLKA
ncbi:DUF6596 domain-containing protein [Lapillicoccus sp.]|uniref:RNA polymerase sigma factor n=1 Tax=Lapillicoccus sp. TaxID=1909287 RepID=UPI0032649B47